MPHLWWVIGYAGCHADYRCPDIQQKDESRSELILPKAVFILRYYELNSVV
jgi:hypothetical protein